MTVASKPPVRPIWADTATPPLDLVDPGDAFITAGWPSSGTPPSRGRFNFILKYLWDGIRYFSRRGITDWDSAETYQSNDIVRSVNSLLYRSLINNNTNNDPDANFGTKWTTLAVNTLPTGDNSGNIPNTQFVNTAIGNEATSRAAGDAAAITTAENFATAAVAVESSSRSLGDANTLNAANTTTFNGLALKANAANASLTGVPSAPTAARGTSTGQLATTAFVIPGNFHSTNGFEILPSGLILQWGGITVSNGTNTVIDASITFPMAFPVACYGVHPTTARSVAANGQAANGSDFCVSPALNGATISIDSSGGGQSSARWWAIGV